jgi:Domain of unknown function (DUF4249)
MQYFNCRYILLLSICTSSLLCKQPYNPPALAGGTHYLVVDGSIISGDDSTIISLSRTQNLSDSTYNFLSVAETGAAVSVVRVSGDSYTLTEQSPGKYVSAQLALNPSELYQLQIITAGGQKYLSDSVPVIITPPIDSISYQLENDGMHVFVNTHDPTNNTRYFRWRYSETWEYQSARSSTYIYLPQDSTTVPRDPSQDVSTCWIGDQSTNLLLGSSVQLSQDIIYDQLLTLIPPGTQKLSVEYSILVYQYALTSGSYSFFQLLQQTTEQLGSLFDMQPSELTGNIHNVANRNEPVLGYISASTLQQQRIFIQRPNSWV